MPAGNIVALAAMVIFAVTAFAWLVDPNGWSGLLLGVTAGIWTAWALPRNGVLERCRLLRPVDKEYMGTSQHVFSKVRKVLKESTHKSGNKWHSEPDTQANHISSDLRFTIEGKQNNVSLKADIEDTEHETAILRLRFDSNGNEQECESVIRTVLFALDLELGSGGPVGASISDEMPGPPFWLTGAAVISIGWFVTDVLNGSAWQSIKSQWGF